MLFIHHVKLAIDRCFGADWPRTSWLGA